MSTTLTQPLPGSTLPTYTETQGAPPFNWHTFLDKSTHSDDDWWAATHLAGAWVTCACGNQCAALPRHSGGAPEDELLYGLGEDFAHQILTRDVAGARITLARIEERSALLLITQAALAGKECNNCGGLGCPNCHGGANGKGSARD